MRASDARVRCSPYARSTTIRSISHSGSGSAASSRISRRWLFAGIAILAFVVRLVPSLIGGGLGSYGRYDDGVYYAASDALTFGRVPYHDFVLLHPPGIMLVLAPFALLGRLTSDPVGMAVGRVFFMGIGGLNAVLVTALAYRWGRRAALTAGLLYACWMPAVYTETSTLLEPLGTTALLVALLLLLKTARPPTRRAEVLAGIVLGLAFAMKIWYIVPWAVVFVWQIVARRQRAAVRVAVGGAAALLVVVLPFAILAGSRMWDMVIRDQLLRPDKRSSRAGRLSSILGVRPLVSGHDHTDVVVITAIALLVLLAAAVVCATDREGRVLVAALAANFGVLLASPSYFAHYAILTAAPAALVLGVAAQRLAAPSPPLLVRSGLGLVVVGILASGVAVVTTPQGKFFSGSRFANAAPSGCVAADDPQVLIQMNRLSRDFRSGCRVEIDVTGITYDTLHREGPNGTTLARPRNAAWQRYLYNYLVGARSFVVARRSGDGLTPHTRRALDAQPALAASHGLVLRSGRVIR